MSQDPSFTSEQDLLSFRADHTLMNNMNQDDDERSEYGKKAGWVVPVTEETRDC